MITVNFYLSVVDSGYTNYYLLLTSSAIIINNTNNDC